MNTLLSLGLLGAAMINHANDLVLADFSDENTKVAWTIVNDTVMGGRSASSFRIADDALHFSGILNTNGGGFASLRSGPISVMPDGHHLIRIRVKGDGRDYQLRLTSAATATTYRATFRTEANHWLVVEIPLERFQATWRGRLLERPPMQAADIGGLGLLLADGKDGPFSISLSWVVLGAAAALPR